MKLLPPRYYFHGPSQSLLYGETGCFAFLCKGPSPTSEFHSSKGYNEMILRVDNVKIVYRSGIGFLAHRNIIYVTARQLNHNESYLFLRVLKLFSRF